MEMIKKGRTGVKFPGEKSFDGAHGTLFVWKTQCHTVLKREHPIEDQSGVLSKAQNQLMSVCLAPPRMSFQLKKKNL